MIIVSVCSIVLIAKITLKSFKLAKQGESGHSTISAWGSVLFLCTPIIGDTSCTRCHLYCGNFSLRTFRYVNQISTGPFRRDELVFQLILTVQVNSDEWGILRKTTSPRGCYQRVKLTDAYRLHSRRWTPPRHRIRPRHEIRCIFRLGHLVFFFCARDSTEKAAYRCRFSVSLEQTSGRPVVWQTDWNICF